VDEARFQELVSAGTIAPTTLVWREGLSEWQPFESIKSGPTAAVSAGTAICQMCGKAVGADNLIELAGVRTCAECKPKVVQSLSEGAQFSTSVIWRDGKKIVASDGAHFPARCVKCNQPTTEPPLKRKLYWHNPIFYLLIFLQIFIYIIVAMIVRKRASVEFHLCREHLDRRKKFLIGVWLSLLLGIVGIVWGIAESHGYVAIAGIVLLLLALTLGIFGVRPLATVKIKDKTVWMRGAGKDFLASLPTWNG
jgi:hypothetical protein